MKKVALSEVKDDLSRLLRIAENEEVVITRNHKPLVKLVRLAGARPSRHLGGAKGRIAMSDDFDAPPADFAPYMK